MGRRRNLLRGGRFEGLRHAGSQRRAPDRSRADGPVANGVVQTGDRRGERLRRRRGLGVGVVVRPAGGRGGCRVRRVLPPLGSTAHRRRHRAATAADRTQPRDGHDPHRPWRGGRRSAGDRVGQSRGAQRPGAAGRRGTGGRTGRAAAAVPAIGSAVGAATVGAIGIRRRSTCEFASISRVAAEATEGAGRFAAGAGRHGAPAVRAVSCPC